MNCSEYIANNISYLVEKENVSQDAWGKLFDLNRGVVGKYINGNMAPKLETLVKISEHYGLLLDDLVRRDIRDAKKFSDETLKNLNKYSVLSIIENIQDREEEFLSHKQFKRYVESAKEKEETTLLKEQMNRLQRKFEDFVKKQNV